MKYALLVIWLIIAFVILIVVTAYTSGPTVEQRYEVALTEQNKENQ